MSLGEFNLAELGVFVVSCCGAMGMCIRQIQHSRCKKLNICCGAINCDRDVETEEVEVEVRN